MYRLSAELSATDIYQEVNGIQPLNFSLYENKFCVLLLLVQEMWKLETLFLVVISIFY
jgi:hypothetical protein